MMQQSEERSAKILGLYSPRKKPRWGTLTIVVLLHVLGFFALLRIFAPDFTAEAIEKATSVITVTVTTTDPQEDEGASAEEGAQATPQEQAAPPPELPIAPPKPLPPAASTGTDTQSGASDAGAGSGGGGEGYGTGSGRGGTGQGGIVAAGPSVRSGELNQARDFPVPEGGRQVRFGRSVTVHFTVTTDGRARNCSVANSQVDAVTTAAVCPLVIEKIRFNPAVTAEGTPVEARYGYRVDFRAR